MKVWRKHNSGVSRFLFSYVKTASVYGAHLAECCVCVCVLYLGQAICTHMCPCGKSYMQKYAYFVFQHMLLLFNGKCATTIPVSLPSHKPPVHQQGFSHSLPVMWGDPNVKLRVASKQPNYLTMTVEPLEINKMLKRCLGKFITTRLCLQVLSQKYWAGVVSLYKLHVIPNLFLNIYIYIYMKPLWQSSWSITEGMFTSEHISKHWLSSVCFQWIIEFSRTGFLPQTGSHVATCTHANVRLLPTSLL